MALFVGRIDMQNAIERRQGVEEKLKTVSGLEILPVFLDNTDRTKAKKNVEDALARYPDLVLTVGLWSYNGACLAGAIRESARAQKPLIIAFDEEEETLKAVEEGLISATIVQKPFEFGYQSMKLLKESKREDGPVRGRHRHRHRRKGEPRRASGRSSASSRSKPCSSSPASRNRSAACRP